MNKLALAIAALLSFAAAGAAGAADLPAPAPMPPAVYKPAPPVPAFSWTGCYVGGGGGYGVWNQDIFGESDPGHVAATPTSTNGGRGWFGTAQGGCDYQVDRFVIGVFGDADFGSLSGTLVDFVSGSENERFSWAAGARVGWLAMPKLLTYVSAGFTQAHFDQVNITGGGVPAGAFVNANSYNGFFIGSGYEYGFDFLPGFFWKTEYRFADYESANLSVLGPGGAPTGTAFHVQPFIQTIRTELVWRFNWGGY
jgi:outer membrane immunogenic protein